MGLNAGIACKLQQLVGNCCIPFWSSVSGTKAKGSSFTGTKRKELIVSEKYIQYSTGIYTRILKHTYGDKTTSVALIGENIGKEQFFILVLPERNRQEYEVAFERFSRCKKL